jgi:hypothetical protein
MAAPMLDLCSSVPTFTGAQIVAFAIVRDVLCALT